MKTYLRYLAAAFLTLTAGCSLVTDTNPPGTPVAQILGTGLAPVERVQIQPANGIEEEIRVLAEGKFNDPCTRIDQVIIQPVERSFVITLTTVQLPKESCPQADTSFQETIPLEVANLQPGTYTVLVNKVSATFRLPGQEEDTLASPTPVIVANPPLPTGTPAPQATPASTPEPSSTVPEVEPVDATQPGTNAAVTQAITVTVPVTAAEETAPQPSPSPAASSSGPSQNAPVDTAACLNKAAFYGDVTITDGTILRQGDTFMKTWRVRNEGTCTWDEGYRLVFTGGDPLNGSPQTSIPTANPGDIVDLSVQLTAPSSGGEFTSNWELQDGQGNRFGTGASASIPLWTKISVSWIDTNAGTSQPVSSTACQVQSEPDYIAQLLALINQARQDQGLEALNLQDQLSAAALVHSTDMACNDYVDHIGSDGSRWYDRITAQGYTYTYASENIYVGDPQFGGTPQGAFDWWMDSQIHRDNILSQNVIEIGIGYAYLPGSTYGGYYTLVFAHP